MQESTQPTEYVTLPSGGSIPGIPSSHGPGRYIIDWIERTLTPVVDAVESEIAHIEEAIHPDPLPEPVPDAVASESVPMPTPESFAPSDTVLNSPAIETQPAN